jgi:tRNA threonylcarbamoyladenosine biosynthesis protein TsaB
MHTILTIDTSNPLLSLSLQREDVVIARRLAIEPFRHAKAITVEIEQLLLDQSLGIKDLSAVAINEGPGSFTGLRVGSSVAKGLCFGLNIPFISVRGIEEYANYFYHYFEAKYDNIFILLDARRNNFFYTQVFKGKIEHPIAFDSFENIYRRIESCRSKWVYQSNEINEIVLEASFLSASVWEKYCAKAFEDIANFEPNYFLNNYTKA